MCDAGAIHFEPLKRPVSRGDRTHEAGRYMVTLELHRIERIEFTRPRRLLEHLVDGRFQVGVKRLE